MADKLQGTWVLNDPPSYEDFDEFDENQYSCTVAFVEFISNDTTYTAFTATHNPSQCTIQYLNESDGVYAYEDYINASSGGWANEAYKTIYVTSTITGTSGAEYTFRQRFLTWLESNATKQIEPITYDLTQLNLSEGTHTITVKGKADGYRDSAVSDGVSYVVEEPIVENALTFSSPSTFTLGIVDNAKYWDGTLEYSTDASTWSTWSGTSAISSSANGKLYMRGTGNTYITGGGTSSTNGPWVLTGTDISCSGNIENLLDYATVANGEHPTMASRCYSNMFNNCTSLTTAPELPATTLAERCYYNMFYGCTGLTTAPKLPATTLVNFCYASMFQGCTSLTTVPELPATTLARYCYYYMFDNCTGLTTVPNLPATTLAERCYYNMFNGCTNLKLSTNHTGEYTIAYRIPSSGTGTTASSALGGMFYGTGGTFTGDPSINTTYYLHSSNTVV